MGWHKTGQVRLSEAGEYFGLSILPISDQSRYSLGSRRFGRIASPFGARYVRVTEGDV